MNGTIYEVVNLGGNDQEIIFNFIIEVLLWSMKWLLKD